MPGDDLELNLKFDADTKAAEARLKVFATRIDAILKKILFKGSTGNKVKVDFAVKKGSKTKVTREATTLSRRLKGILTVPVKTAFAGGRAGMRGLFGFSRGISGLASGMRSFNLQVAAVITATNQLRDIIQSISGLIIRTFRRAIGFMVGGFQAIRGAIIEPTEQFRRFNIVLQGALKSAARAKEIATFAQVFAATSPFEQQDIENVIRLLAILPATSGLLKKADFQEVKKDMEGLLETIQGMAAIDPRGISSAMIAFSEGVGGTIQSVRRRLNVSVAALAQISKVPAQEIRAGGEKFIKAMRVFVQRVLGEDTFKEMAKLFSTQFGNVQDSLKLMARQVGQAGLFEVFSDSARRLADTLRVIALDEQFEETASRISASIQVLVKNVIRGAGAFISAIFGINTNFADFLSNVDNFRDGIEGLTSTLELLANESEKLPATMDAAGQAFKKGIFKLVDVIQKVWRQTIISDFVTIWDLVANATAAGLNNLAIIVRSGLNTLSSQELLSKPSIAGKAGSLIKSLFTGSGLTSSEMVEIEINRIRTSAEVLAFSLNDISRKFTRGLISGDSSQLKNVKFLAFLRNNAEALSSTLNLIDSSKIEEKAKGFELFDVVVSELEEGINAAASNGIEAGKDKLLAQIDALGGGIADRIKSLFVERGSFTNVLSDAGLQDLVFGKREKIKASAEQTAKRLLGDFKLALAGSGKEFTEALNQTILSPLRAGESEDALTPTLQTLQSVSKAQTTLIDNSKKLAVAIVKDLGQATLGVRNFEDAFEAVANSSQASMEDKLLKGIEKLKEGVGKSLREMFGIRDTFSDTDLDALRSRLLDSFDKLGESVKSRQAVSPMLDQVSDDLRKVGADAGKLEDIMGRLIGTGAIFDQLSDPVQRAEERVRLLKEQMEKLATAEKSMKKGVAAILLSLARDAAAKSTLTEGGAFFKETLAKIIEQITDPSVQAKLAKEMKILGVKGFEFSETEVRELRNKFTDAVTEALASKQLKGVVADVTSSGLSGISPEQLGKFREFVQQLQLAKTAGRLGFLPDKSIEAITRLSKSGEAGNVLRDFFNFFGEPTVSQIEGAENALKAFEDRYESLGITAGSVKRELAAADSSVDAQAVLNRTVDNLGAGIRGLEDDLKQLGLVSLDTSGSTRFLEERLAGVTAGFEKEKRALTALLKLIPELAREDATKKLVQNFKGLEAAVVDLEGAGDIAERAFGTRGVEGLSRFEGGLVAVRREILAVVDLARELGAPRLLRRASEELQRVDDSLANLFVNMDQGTAAGTLGLSDMTRQVAFLEAALGKINLDEVFDPVSIQSIIRSAEKEFALTGRPPTPGVERLRDKLKDPGLLFADFGTEMKHSTEDSFAGGLRAGLESFMSGGGLAGFIESFATTFIQGVFDSFINELSSRVTTVLFAELFGSMSESAGIRQASRLGSADFAAAILSASEVGAATFAAAISSAAGVGSAGASLGLVQAIGNGIVGAVGGGFKMLGDMTAAGDPRAIGLDPSVFGMARGGKLAGRPYGLAKQATYVYGESGRPELFLPLTMGGRVPVDVGSRGVNVLLPDGSRIPTQSIPRAGGGIIGGKPASAGPGGDKGDREITIINTIDPERNVEMGLSNKPDIVFNHILRDINRRGPLFRQIKSQLGRN